MERFAAGATAGAIAQTSIYPMEVSSVFHLLLTWLMKVFFSIAQHILMKLKIWTVHGMLESTL